MELQSLFFLVTVLTVLSVVRIKLKQAKATNKSRKLPPGPWKLPLVGNMHQLAGALPHHALRDMAKKHGPLFHLQLGEVSAIVISSPRLAKEALKKHDLAFSDRPDRLAGKIVAYNNTDIVCAPHGDYWKQMRKICTMEFLSAKKVRSFRSIREDESWLLVESIQTCSEAPINLSEMTESMINAITCRMAFGNKCKDQDTLIAIIKELVSLAGGFDVIDVFPSLKFLHVFSDLRSKMVKIHKKMDNILNTITDERRRERFSGGRRGNLSIVEEDLLDVLLRLKDSGGLEIPLTLDNVKAVISDVFVAGTDTSSITIEWAMAEMIRNPRVMEKAQNELRLALKGKNKIYESDIEGLSYLKLVIKETLRLHPPSPLLVPHECREECNIDGYIIPVKTRLIVNAWQIGRDPGYWKDAESFIPERFENSSISFLGSDFEYLPFGAGRRMCPGASLAFANIELSLALLLYHFNWQLSGKMKPEDLDMNETFGLAARREKNLYLIPTFQHNV